MDSQRDLVTLFEYRFCAIVQTSKICSTQFTKEMELNVEKCWAYCAIQTGIINQVVKAYSEVAWSNYYQERKWALICE